MALDLPELERVAGVLEEAHVLLESDHKRLEQHYQGSSMADTAAGSPSQTLRGVRDLSEEMAKSRKQVALAAGYSVLGFDQRADHALRMARRRPVSFPSGADRMARPLGEATVRAMELIRDLGFFDAEVSLTIDVALAAPQATYPPADWDAWTRERMQRGERF
ncbi:hypothetical protein ABTZ78_12910 [Streptomyces bauhiniae]|uniref:hypothetical protein n=1 Tax=Streptomyces bauhiniae TaxID=2340725 RepID=UPI003327EB62